MAKKPGIKLIANNKKAFHDYFIEDTYEAGIALAEELIDSGKALDTLQKLIEGSNRGEGCV